MKITIDTRVDSKEDIMKAIALLHGLSGIKKNKNVFESDDSYLESSQEEEPKSAPLSSPGFMSMFGDMTPVQVEKKEEEKPDRDEFSGLITY